MGGSAPFVTRHQRARAAVPPQGQEISRAAFCLMSPSARPAELGDVTKTGAGGGGAHVSACAYVREFARVYVVFNCARAPELDIVCRAREGERAAYAGHRCTSLTVCAAVRLFSSVRAARIRNSVLCSSKQFCCGRCLTPPSPPPLCLVLPHAVRARQTAC